MEDYILYLQLDQEYLERPWECFFEQNEDNQDR